MEASTVELPLAANDALVGGVSLPDLESDAGGEQENRIEHDRGGDAESLLLQRGEGGAWRGRGGRLDVGACHEYLSCRLPEAVPHSSLPWSILRGAASKEHQRLEAQLRLAEPACT